MTIQSTVVILAIFGAKNLNVWKISDAIILILQSKNSNGTFAVIFKHN